MEYILTLDGKQTRTKRVLLQMVNGVNPPQLMHSDVHPKGPVIHLWSYWIRFFGRLDITRDLGMDLDGSTSVQLPHVAVGLTRGDSFDVTTDHDP